MVKVKDIMTAINQLIIKPYPDDPVYVQTCPKDFARPSFWLEYVRLSQVDANRSTVEKTVYFSITCFAPVDKRFRSDPDELSALQDSILDLFAEGYISVGDRSIKVQSSTGGMDIDRAYIDLQFNFYDNRTDEEDQTPLITSVTTRILEG